MKPSKDLLTVNEAAAALGKRPETVRRWIAAGRLKTVRQGAHVLVAAAALDMFKRRRCEHCGKAYTPDRPTRGGRYCSPACTWTAAYERRKAEHPAARGPGRPPKHATAPAVDITAAPDRLRAVLRHIQKKRTP
jgi:excisionase family DNA binding protein